MLTVTGLWFDHERTPVGLDHTPVFGWQLEGNCRNIRQTQYRLQVALTPDFAALLYDETSETGNSTAVLAAGLPLQSLLKYSHNYDHLKDLHHLMYRQPVYHFLLRSQKHHLP